MRTAILLLIVTFLAAVPASAEPYEFYGCTFKEGYGMADLDKAIATWKKVKQVGSYKAVVLTPQYSNNPDSPDFFWMGTWPDASAMGDGQKHYYEDGAGAAAEAAFAKITTCTSSLWWGRTVSDR